MFITNDRPAYRILAVSGFFGPDDHLYTEGSVIYFDDTPNEEMEPLNEKARVAMATYQHKLDALAREAAEKAGRPFTGRPQSLEEAIAQARENAMAMPTQHSRRVQLVEGDGGVPLTRARKNTQRIIEAVPDSPEPAEDGRKVRRAGPMSIAG